MEKSADEVASEYGLIAESVALAEDHSYIIFYLRKQARWQDNTPITADDVVFSFQTLIKKGHPHYASYYQDIEEAIKLDTYTVKFTFKHNNNKELPVIIGQLPIISKQYYQNHPFDKTTLTTPLGSGPYSIKAIDPGKSIIYQRNNHYWAKDLPVNTGRYNFDTIEIKYYRDNTVAIEALKAGEYDFRKENISKNWAKAYNIKQVTKKQIIKEELLDGVPTGMQGFVFNTRRPPFKNPRIREALSLAYDFEWANTNLFYSAYTRNKSFFGNSPFASHSLPSKEELTLLQPFTNLLPPRLFTTPYNPPSTGKTHTNRQNLLKAKEILEEEGWVLKDMQRIHPDTQKPVTIEFLLHSAAFERVVAPYLRNLKKLGISATIRTVDASQYIKRQQTFDFDIIVHWFTQSSIPGNEQINYWHSSRAHSNGSQNLAGIENPAVDAMVEKVITATNKEEMITATHALDRILLWNFYVLPQWHSRTHRVLYWNHLSRPEKTPPYDLGVIDTWWYHNPKPPADPHE